MKHLWQHFKYTVKHKFWVFVYCEQEGLYWRGFMHDMSKFLPSEFFPYANWFFSLEETPRMKRDFDYAWLLHQRRNKHHWSYWVSVNYEGGHKVNDMPDVYIKEMICDWRAAGKAQGNGDGSLSYALKYYNDNKDRMILSNTTRTRLEFLLGK